MAARLTALLDRADRDLFVPITFSLARRLEQVEWAELVEDTGLAVFTLHSSLRTFSADGVVNWFDSWLEAESAGAICERDDEGRVIGPGSSPAGLPDAEDIVKAAGVSAAIEIASRLCQQTGDKGLVLGYLTGPATLHRRLHGPERTADAASRELCARVSTAIARAYCDASISALLLAEEDPSEDAAPVESLSALFNLSEYYGAPVVYLSRSPVSAAVAASLGKLGAWIAGPAGKGEVITLPVGEAAPDTCIQSMQGAPAGHSRRLVLSAWDVPPETPPEDVIGLAQHVRTH